ncbi:MAG: PEP-CTERM sorting domain-containing protein [Phycisphaera sp.]|nr:MAG: PEP-CTERM sorting domain-containing protein [Phycisphaera sp.]
MTRCPVFAAVLVCIGGSIGVAQAQPVLRVQSELFVSGNDQVGVTDQDSFDMAIPLRAGESLSRSVSIQEPGQLPISSSVDFSVDEIRILSGPIDVNGYEWYTYEVDISARLFRTAPEFYANGIAAESELSVSFDFGDPPPSTDVFMRGAPVFASGQASYTTDQFISPSNPLIFQIDGSFPDNPLVSLIADDTTGAVDFTDLDVQGLNPLRISAMADATNILIEHIGTTEVEYDVTVLLVGPIPAPSTLAPIGLVGFFAIRRRR